MSPKRVTGGRPASLAIHCVTGKVLETSARAGGQFVMRMKVPAVARQAAPGQFVHLQCDPLLPMRRPMSIMRASAGDGWVEILFRVFGLGTRLLSEMETGDPVEAMGPIGVPFKRDGYRSRPLLIGGGVGVPPMIFLAEHIKRDCPDVRPLVLMGSEVPFPFSTRPSRLLLSGFPASATACLPLLEDWGIASRLASGQARPGCYEGQVTDLAGHLLRRMQPAEREAVELFACGPEPMLKATADLAHEYSLPCQIAVEEFMACGTGGCAGCTIPVQIGGRRYMQRVCVEGPVFEAAQVYPRRSPKGWPKP